MAKLQETVDRSRGGESNDPVREKGYPPYFHGTQRNGLGGSNQGPALDKPEGGWEEGGSEKQISQQQADDQNPATAKGPQDQFYQKYHEVAEEYDKEFLYKYNEDLSTTLIFAGLFSAVTSAFIIEVNSELKPDPNDETAALLRVLLYKIDNTTFGNDVPPLPQWTGPPHAMVQVQTVLFASLAASLLSALLAVLGKQWLSRYDSADVRGSAVERAQNRQRKLDGIDTWYFYYTMEALPLMLQVALLLLGCALSRYLWGINVTLASVVLGFTSLGVMLYLLIIIAGSAYEDCPYQTPGAATIRHMLHLFRISPQPRSTDQQKLRLDLRCISWILRTSLEKGVHRLTFDYICTIPELPHVESALVSDCFNIFVGCINARLGKLWIVEGTEQLATAAAAGFLRISYQFLATDPTSTAVVDLRRDYRKNFKLSPRANFRGLPFRYTMISIHALINEDWNLRHISWDGNRPPIPEHMLLTRYILRAAREGFRQSKRRKVPRWTLRFALYSLSMDPPPPAFIVANCLKIVAIDLGCDISDGLAWIEGALVQKTSRTEVEKIFNMKEEEIWSGQVNGVSRLIARKLGIMIEAGGPHSDLIFSKRKAIWTLFRHAVSSLPHQGEKVVIEILRAARVSESFLLFLHYISPSVTALFSKPSSPLTDQIILLVTPHVPSPWLYLDNGNRVARWNAIASNALDTDQDVVSADMGSEKAVSDVVVSVSVVDTLLQSAEALSLRHRILAGNWAWLKKLPPLPPFCRGRQIGTTNNAVRQIRGLGDIEILKSYLLLVWSEWDCIDESGFDEMENSIREDFGGMERWGDREKLIERLDRVLGQLSQGLEHLRKRKPQLRKNDVRHATSQYLSLKDTLLEGHMKALLRLLESRLHTVRRDSESISGTT